MNRPTQMKTERSAHRLVGEPSAGRSAAGVARDGMVPRVVHITTVHPPFDHRIFHRECRSLAEEGYHVTLLASCDQALIRDGIHVEPIGGPKRRDRAMQFTRRAQRTVHALRRALTLPAEVYHLHDPETLWVALTLKLLTRAAVVYDCHEDNIGFMKQKEYLPAVLRPILVGLVGIMEWLAAKCLDCIVTADSGVRRRFEKSGAATVCLHNFPRLEFFAAAPGNGTPTYDLAYHGSLPRYHLKQCFAIDDELVARGVRARWLLFGVIHDRSWANEEIARRNASDRICLGEPVAQEAVAEKVASSRIGIIPLPDLPKFQHNIPTKLFEFMALGKPVVMSDLPPSRPFVGDGACAILVPPENAAAYAESILTLLGDSGRCTAMGAEGRRRVEQMYNWGSESENLLDLYESLLTDGKIKTRNAENATVGG